jgi:aldehyde dehydrogenase (NAD+)
LSFIEKGKKEGLKVLIGGSKHQGKGYFVEPTIFRDVDDSSFLSVNEIFGPILVALKPFKVNLVLVREGYK